MRKRKKSIKWFVLLAVAISLTISYIAYRHSRTDNIRHIGILSVLSGEFSKIGQDVLKGAMLYVDDYNRSHVDFPIRLAVEDGRAEAKTAATVFSKLLSEKVLGCIVVGDNQVSPVAEMAVRNKMPILACSVGTSVFLSENKPGEVWILKYSSSVAVEASKLAIYAKTGMGLTNVALLTMEGGFGSDSGTAFSKSFIDAGGKVTEHETFVSKGNDVKSQISKILQSNPDAIYVSGYGIGYFMAINQIRESGFEKIILTTDSVSTPYAKEAIKSCSNILYSGFVVERTEAYIDFEKAYQEKYHELPTRDSVYGYDSIALICDALDNALDGRNLVDNILFHSCAHLAGDVQFLQNGDTIFPISFIWAEQNGIQAVFP
ncbi:MAG: ABC transporter substrate-binding protein [Kiritimatiellae bacterium]|nr:ABC transporter substrate-binding protein [Kiritimatiellia bacterium]